jgi:hypothetical protein
MYVWCESLSLFVVPLRVVWNVLHYGAGSLPQTWLYMRIALLR